MSRLLALLIGLGIAGSIAFVSPAMAGEIYTDQKGRAIFGYDTTAYFRVNRPQEGSSAYTTRWKGAIWRFASKSDRDAFAANPAKYAPQFGGHCANGLAEGHLVSGNPRNWIIVGTRLYVFHLPRGSRIWRASSNVKGLIAQAWSTWRRLGPKSVRNARPTP